MSIQASPGCRPTPDTLTFDPAEDWTQPQTVRVKVGASCTVTQTATGGGYDGVEIADVEITKSLAYDAPPVPALAVETFLCVNLATHTGGAMAGQGGIANMALNGAAGDTYCHVIAQDVLEFDGLGGGGDVAGRNGGEDRVLVEDVV